MNPVLWVRFDDGHLVECLVGDGHYFIRDDFWGTHNWLLVVRELVEWAAERGTVDEVRNSLIAAVESLVARAGSAGAYPLILAYVMNRRARDVGVRLDPQWCIGQLDEVDRRVRVGTAWWDTPDFRARVRTEVAGTDEVESSEDDV